MVFFASSAPDITESIPLVVSSREEIAATYTNSKVQYDYAIGGLPFLLAVDEAHPYQRQTDELRKQQIDTSKEAGEQTLDQWWTRSQTSWHRGEGINYYEPTADPDTEYRYAHAVGVDVWTKGEIRLLNAMDKVANVVSGTTYVATGSTSGTYFTNENGVLKRRTASGSTSYANTGTAPATAPVVAGSKILVGHGAGIDVADSTGSSLSKLYTASGGVVTPWWAKGRIIAGQGNKLFELPLAVTTPPVAIGTEFYAHPISTWQWTAVTDAPGAILAAGYSDGHSVIYKFQLEDAGSGATPKLGQAYQVAEFPPGEIVHSLFVYLGQYLGIGTSRGVRVGVVDANGNIQYGPLIVETTAPVYDLAASGSFIYAAVTNAIDGRSGAVRINLGEPLEEALRFAYAWDVQTHAIGNATSIAFLGGTERVVLGVDGAGIYLQSDTTYEANGYLTSGKVRYATTENKAFKRVRIAATAARAGEGVSVLFLDAKDSERFIVRVDSKASLDGDISLGATGTLPHASVKLQLDAATDGTSSPVFDSLLIKALPVVQRHRLVQVPLLCFDSESDRFGASFNSDGGAALRLAALEELESKAATVIAQDFTSGESFEAEIAQVAFRRTSPPSQESAGFGGLLTVTLRKLS